MGICMKKNEIVHYKARLVVQGFSQRPGIDYEETFPSHGCNYLSISNKLNSSGKIRHATYGCRDCISIW